MISIEKVLEEAHKEDEAYGELAEARRAMLTGADCFGAWSCKYESYERQQAARKAYATCYLEQKALEVADAIASSEKCQKYDDLPTRYKRVKDAVSDAIAGIDQIAINLYSFGNDGVLSLSFNHELENKSYALSCSSCCMRAAIKDNTGRYRRTDMDRWGTVWLFSIDKLVLSASDFAAVRDMTEDDVEALLHQRQKAEMEVDRIQREFAAFEREQKAEIDRKKVEATRRINKINWPFSALGVDIEYNL